MERPAKRPRLSFTEDPDEGEDSHDVDLQAARAQNDLRLKSIFEGIFEKYEKDFTEIGDEIDLQTGNIVVNNGHIQGMEGEDDTGEEGRAWLFDPDLADDDPNGQGQDQGGTRLVDYGELELGATEGGDTQDHHDKLSRRSPNLLFPSQSQPGLDGACEAAQDEAANAELEADDDRSSVDSLLDSALDVQNNPNDSRARKNRISTDKPGAEKANLAAGETSAQSPGTPEDRFAGLVESVWRVPEISGRFTTTPTWNKSRPTLPSNANRRSESPPGAESLWALPWKSSSRRDNTESSKKKSPKKPSPKKPKISHPGRKPYQSSPIVPDWSFAETPDGSESDDPLQENYQPSPTPNRSLKIREKKQATTPSRTNQCDYCKQSFSRNDYILHLIAVLGSDSPDGHDITEMRKQLDAITSGSKAPQMQPKISNDIEAQGISRNTDTSEVEPKKSLAVANESTPTNKRARTIMTPDEARLIVTMRQVQGKKWKEISDNLPHKKLMQVTQWNQIHWNDRHANPPELSEPWSEAERETLNSFKDQQGLTWPSIRAALPGRSHAEIEFELLRLWVGDKAAASFGMEQATETNHSPRLRPDIGGDDHLGHKVSAISTA